MAKILLVEDDTNLSEIYQARMEAEGYTVIAASDGESALALAAKEKPDLILSDVMMPKISGFEMLDILRNTDGLKQTKVIMLTALGQAEDSARAVSLGADKYLVKSQVTLEDIVSAAQELLGENSLPTPAELAAPTITAETPTNVSTDPAQSAPSEPLPATTPVALAVDPTTVAAATPTVPVDQPSDTTAVPTLMPVTDAPADDATASVDAPATSTPDPATTSTAAVDPAASNAPAVSAEPALAEPAPVVDNTPQPLVEPLPSQAETDASQPSADEAASVSSAPVVAATEGLIEVETPEQAAAYMATVASSPSSEPVVSPDIPAPTATPALVEEPPQVTHMPVQEPSAPVAPVEMPVVAAAPTATTEPVIPMPTSTDAQPSVTEPAANPTAEVPAATEPPATEPVAPAATPTVAAIDEKVVANAVDKLLAKSPSDADEAAITPSESNGSPHKKIISPITHGVQPTLQELLAKEDAKEAGNSIAPAATPEVVAENTSNADSALSQDEADAAALLAKAQAATNAAFSSAEEAPTNLPPELQAQLAPELATAPAAVPAPDTTAVAEPAAPIETPVVEQPPAAEPVVAQQPAVIPAANPTAEVPAATEPPAAEPVAPAATPAPPATDPTPKKAFDPNSIAL